MSHGGIRKMLRTPDGHWVVYCRVCPKRHVGKRVFDTARECHDWWREHASTKYHQSMVNPPPLEWLEVHHRTRKLVDDAFGPSKPSYKERRHLAQYKAATFNHEG